MIMFKSLIGLKSSKKSHENLTYLDQGTLKPPEKIVLTPLKVFSYFSISYGRRILTKTFQVKFVS